jgi:hypothetical protein
MFNIVEGIVRLINSVGTAITSTTNGSKISLDTHVANTVSVPANVSSVVSGAVIDPRSPAIDTTSTGTITAAGSQPLDFKGIPFYTGLFYTVTSQSANVILMYE